MISRITLEQPLKKMFKGGIASQPIVVIKWNHEKIRLLQMNRNEGKREQRIDWDPLKTSAQMVNLNPVTAIITLNVNCLNTPLLHRSNHYVVHLKRIQYYISSIMQFF